MSRFYRVPYSGTLTNAGGNADLLEVSPASNKPVRLVGWIIGQTSELSDAAEESLRITINRLAATVTSGNGTSVTPVANDSNDGAAGFTAECNGATVATTNGTLTLMEDGAWNIRATPYERWIPEELRPRFVSGEALVVRCESTVADDISVAMTFFLEEL